MKKAFTFLVLLAGTIAANGQQDFDFKLYTEHVQSSYFKEKDNSMIDMLTPKIIQKEGDRLIIRSVRYPTMIIELRIFFEEIRTGDFPGVQFPGWGERAIGMHYKTNDFLYDISIWPWVPLVLIRDAKTGEVYKKFF